MTSCIEWLPVCNAECCRGFRTRVPAKIAKSFKKGKIISLPHKFDQELAHYYLLHNAKLVHGTLIIRLNEYDYQNGFLYVYADCTNLNKDMTCKGYPDKRPEICKRLNETSVNDPSIFITPNCRFKKTEI